MRRIFWIGAAFSLLCWSLVTWGIYGLIGAAGGFIAQQAYWVSGHPQTVEWISWALQLATDLGLIGVMVAWLGGGIAIIVACAALTWLLERGLTSHRPRRQ